MKYRAEIDGLRAFAILPVVLFHAGVGLFSGGFVGVDIFFVISGYLITSIILRELVAKKFSILTFYERRARRILPALFVVMFVCIPFVLAWFTYEDILRFFSSLIAASTFWSNIFFFEESGYFDSLAEMKPLLHTWSLSVEEQYYVIGPLFLMALWRFGRKNILWIMGVIALISLIGAELLYERKPEAAFYLLPARGWEILIGSFAAFILEKGLPSKFSPLLCNLASGLGAVMVAASFFAFNANLHHPGLVTLIPVVGTALIIVFAQNDTLVQRVLANRVFVGVGLISYSTYLWHHPIFAFTKYITQEPPSLGLMLALSCFSLVLGYLSWRFAEKPFRNRDFLSRRAILTVSLLGIGFFVLVGFAGKKIITPNNVLSVSQGHYYLPKDETGYVGGADVMIIGDSHGWHLVSGLKMLLGHKRIIDGTKSSCLPFHKILMLHKKGACHSAINKNYAEFENNPNLKTVVISNMGTKYLENTTFGKGDEVRHSRWKMGLEGNPNITDNYEMFELAMRDTFDRLTIMPNKKIIYVLDVPEMNFERHTCGVEGIKISLFNQSYAMRSKQMVNCAVPRAAYNKHIQRYQALVKKIVAAYPSVILFDPTSIFCDETTCRGIQDGEFLYMDRDHLTPYGSKLVAKKLAPIIMETLK